MLLQMLNLMAGEGLADAAPPYGAGAAGVPLPAVPPVLPANMIPVGPLPATYRTRCCAPRCTLQP